MMSTYNVIGVPDALAVGLCVFTFIILLNPYFSGLDFGLFKIPQVPANAHKPLKIFGPFLFVAAVFAFYPVWPVIEVPAKNPPNMVDKLFNTIIKSHNSEVTFDDIPDLPERIKTFSVSTTPTPTITLWFTSEHWDIKKSFKVSHAVTVGELKAALLTHFQLAERTFITSSGDIAGTHESAWILTANGKKISDQKQDDHETNADTLAQMNLKDGYVLEFVLELSVYGRIEHIADADIEDPAAILVKQERDIAAAGSIDRYANVNEQTSSISDQRDSAKPARQSLAAAARQRRERLATQAATERAANAPQATLFNIDIQQRATRTNSQSSRGVDREADRRVQSQAPTLDNNLASVSASDRLVLDFTTDSWVEVYDANGEAMRLGVERAGDRLMLRGKAPFDVLVGFSRGVTMTLNGERVPIKQHQFSDSTRLVVGGADDYFSTEQTYEDTPVIAANESTLEELDYAKEDTIDEQLDDRQAIGTQANDEDPVEEQAAQEGQRAVDAASEQLAAADKRVNVPARYSRPFATPASSTFDELETSARQINTGKDDIQRDRKSPLVSKQDELQFTFSAECWVEVYDVAQQPLVMDTKYAGETLELKGQGPFEVRLGNSRAVSLKFNGQKIEIKQDKYIGSTEFFVGSR